MESAKPANRLTETGRINTTTGCEPSFPTIHGDSTNNAHEINHDESVNTLLGNTPLNYDIFHSAPLTMRLIVA